MTVSQAKKSPRWGLAGLRSCKEQEQHYVPACENSVNARLKKPSGWLGFRFSTVQIFQAL